MTSPVTGWALGDSDPGSPTAPSSWIDAAVPGGVHEALVAAGRLRHPYRDRNEADAAWVEERSWWYRATFTRPEVPAGSAASLHFAGVDTVATVWLDGVQVATHASAFRPLDVPLPAGEPGAPVEVLVRIDPPLWNLAAPAGPVATRDRMRAYFAAQGAMVGGEEPSGVMSLDLAATLRRKPLFSWGWDFAPRLPSVGLIGPVEVRVEPHARIDAVAFRTLRLDVDHARIGVGVQASAAARGLRVDWVLLDPDGVEVAHGDGPRAEADVARPRLWWTHDLGEPARHTLRVDLRDAGGTLVHRRVERVGIRTVELDRGPDDEGGRRFRFVLNGVPTFARGANWVPPSMLPGSVTPEHVRGLVAAARGANMTMLRVWGGGRYEDDAFYDACDELGLLVWQDAMFACVDYPDTDPVLCREVTAELEHQIVRLRNRPCLALWCGNNEASAMHHAIWGTEEPGGWGEFVYDDLLPGLVACLSPDTPYWRGSPHGEIDGANGVFDGDRHAWEVWHGGDLGAGGPVPTDPGQNVHFRRYAADRARFVSEFGLHAAPELSTLRRWTDEPLDLDSPSLRHRIKDTPKDKGAALLAAETGHPRSATEYVSASMMVQAEGLAFGIAHYRRRQPTCSGTLVWQLDEPWPGLSWSVLDHDGVPKAAWYALRRAYAPVVASLRESGDGVEVWLTNSSPRPWSGELVARLGRFAGGYEAVESIAAEVAAHGSVCVGRLPAPSDPRAVFAEVVDASGAHTALATGAGESDAIREIAPGGRVGVTPLPRARLFFAPLKDLPLDGSVDVTVHADDADRAEGRARVDVTARGHAYAVRVEPASAAMRSSDGYLDLPAGASATIDVTGLPAGFADADVRVRTWADDRRGER